MALTPLQNYVTEVQNSTINYNGKDYKPAGFIKQFRADHEASGFKFAFPDNRQISDADYMLYYTKYLYQAGETRALNGGGKEIAKISDGADTILTKAYDNSVAAALGTNKFVRMADKNMMQDISYMPGWFSTTLSVQGRDLAMIASIAETDPQLGETNIAAKLNSDMAKLMGPARKYTTGFEQANVAANDPTRFYHIQFYADSLLTENVGILRSPVNVSNIAAHSAPALKDLHADNIGKGTIKLGSQSKAAQAISQFLASKGFLSIEEAGNTSKATAALAKYQASVGLDNDGIAGKDTKAKIREEIAQAKAGLAGVSKPESAGDKTANALHANHKPHAPNKIELG